MSGGVWTDIGQLGDSVGVADAVVAFTTPGAAGRVLQVYDADAKRLLLGPGGLVPAVPADDFVLGPHGLVAFRASAVSRHERPQVPLLDARSELSKKGLHAHFARVPRRPVRRRPVFDRRGRRQW